MPSSLDIAIIIPCADDIRLERCLSSIDEDVEVVVALNGASSGVVSIVERAGVRFSAIADRNLPAACNAGIDTAHATSVLLMNSDCVFGPGAIRLLHDALADAIVARGQVIFEWTTWPNRILAQAHGAAYADPRKAYQPALAFRKEVIEHVGYYFDGDLHWTEDADFSRRLHRAGLVPRYVPESIVYHPSYTVRQSLKSTWCYGVGRRIAEEKALVGTTPPYRPWSRAMWRRFVTVKDHYGFPTALYASVLWSGAFSLGYLAQIVGDVYGVRRRLEMARRSPETNQ